LVIEVLSVVVYSLTQVVGCTRLFSSHLKTTRKH